MTKDEYTKEGSILFKEYEKNISEQFVMLTEQFKKDNPDIKMNDIASINKFEENINYLILSCAWIIDRLNDHDTYPLGYNYHKSLTKKIRKILGYHY